MTLPHSFFASSLIRRVLSAFLILAALEAAGADERGRAAVVVYNKRSPDSQRVAYYYAQKRGVPTNQVVGLELPLGEEISRGEFKSQLQEPLFTWLVAQRLFTLSPTNTASREPSGVVASTIRYAALCYGVPLKIRADATLNETNSATLPAELRRNEAAVDSELTWLPRLPQGVRLSGILTNGCYATTSTALLHPTNGMLLVARLDGPTAEVACGLVDKALAAERDGLWGRAYIDLRGLKEGSYKLGDDLLHAAARFCSQMGYDVAVDLAPETFAKEFPLSQVAVYAGWYNENVSGPFTQPIVEFMPGAFAYHLHSFSAASLRTTNAHWAGPLLAKGATVTLGSVYEPYLAGTADVGRLLRNWLLLGFSFAEAAWSAELGLSWQTTVVGDPLYRPWGVTLMARQKDLEQRQDCRVEWAHAMQFDRQLGNGRPPAGVAYELKKLPCLGTSAVLSEKLGDVLRLQNSPAGAADAYAQALRSQPSHRQRLRLLLARADAQLASGTDVAALESLKEVVREFPAYGDDLTFQQRLLSLAITAGDVALTRHCQDDIRRLTGHTNAPANTPKPGDPAAPALDHRAPATGHAARTQGD